jgi:hypothetical protein
MGTIMDYLHWRGDLSFKNDPFNDIDALILSLLSYLTFKDIVPGIESNKGISLKDTSIQYFSKIQTNETKASNINPTASSSFDSELLELLRETAACPRFEDIQLSRYNENTDFIVGQQFAAITFSLPNEKHEKIVAFRGTDNSLIGWKEDFEIAYMDQTPAQESASRYLDRVVGFLSGKATVCGHSKGGNLAVYACSQLNSIRRNKLSRIINFDGPGFDFSNIPRASFSYFENKVCNYVPEESIVGMLLEPVGKRTVVSSSARSINQHNALNWRVERSNFVYGNMSSTTKLLEQTLTTWLAELPLPKRKMFIEALFDILGASEGRTIDPMENLKEIKNILIKYSKLDNETKALLTEVFLSLTTQTKNTLSTTIKENLPKFI